LAQVHQSGDTIVPEAPPSARMSARPELLGLLGASALAGAIGGALAVAWWNRKRGSTAKYPGSTLPTRPYDADDDWARVIHDNFQEPRLWEGLKTRSGLQGDLVVAALQKEIRRGGSPENAENACLLALDLIKTGPAAEDKLWQRLQVISCEDVGLGSPLAPVIVNALHQMSMNFHRQEGDRTIFALHAVRTLCLATKDRSNDEFLTWINSIATEVEKKPHIPDYAHDMHTRKGTALGRGKRHFFTHATKLIPEMAPRNTKYLELVLAGLPPDPADLK